MPTAARREERKRGRRREGEKEKKRGREITREKAELNRWVKVRSRGCACEIDRDITLSQINLDVVSLMTVRALQPDRSKDGN